MRFFGLLLEGGGEAPLLKAIGDQNLFQHFAPDSQTSFLSFFSYILNI